LAGLRDLIRFEPSRGIQLPAWLDRLVSLGIVTSDPKIARRQKIVNVASYAAALNSMSRVLAAPIHEQLGLVGYLRATSGALFVATLLINRLHRYGENTAAMGMVVWFLTSISFATFYYGSTYVQVYFVLIGVLWFLFGLENWRTCLLWTGVVLGAALIVLFYAPKQGIAIAGDPRLVTYVALQSMINAILIVSILIVYALLLLQRAERDLERQSARAEALLSVVLPADVASRLRASPDKPIADRIDGVSILFADLEGVHERGPHRTARSRGCLSQPARQCFRCDLRAVRGREDQVDRRRLYGGRGPRRRLSQGGGCDRASRVRHA
jgi:adenylate cyclase